MKRISVVLILLALLFQVEAAAPKNQKSAQNKQPKQKVIVAKSYSFTEELVDLPIRPFTAPKLNDNDLLEANPQVLKMYENALNAEKWPNVQHNPASAIKAWIEVKNAQTNPFSNIANNRLGDWKKSIELFNKHQENIDKLKILLSTPILPLSQKKGILMKYLAEFGVIFGTQEVFDLTANNPEMSAALKEPEFKAKIKETKQKRCDKDSGKDCYECGKDYAAADYEKLILFGKACKVNYQPGCSEVNKIKAAQEAEKERAAAEEKRKEEELAKKVYSLKEEPLNLIPPFVLGNVSEQDILSADPEVLKKFEALISKEKGKDKISNPGTMMVLWEELSKINEQNPFLATAKKRAAEWRACAEKMYKQDKDLNLVKKAVREAGVANDQKVTVTLKYLNEHGAVFGTMEIINMLTILNSSEFSDNAAVKAKIKDVKKQRCNLNSADDCYTFAINYAASSEEKAIYLKKACYLGRKQACDNDSANQK